MKIAILLFPVIFLFASCASTGLSVTPTAKSHTIAQGVLYRDVTRLIATMESAWGGGCQNPKVLKIESRAPHSEGNSKVTALEHWHIDRCGKSVVYSVSYYSNPEGGTDMSLKKIKG